MSNNLFNFNEGKLKTLPFLFLFSIIFSILFLSSASFVSAVEMGKDPIKGVIINPFADEGTGGGGGGSGMTGNTTYNATYHAISLSTAEFNSTYNETYEAVQLSTAAFNSTYNDTYHNTSLIWTMSVDGKDNIYPVNLSSHVGIGTNNPDLYDLLIRSNDDNNTYVAIASGEAYGNATLSFREFDVLRWSLIFNSKLNTLNLWNANYDKNFLTLTQSGVTQVTINNNLSVTENVWAPNLCYSNGSNCNLTAGYSTYNVSYHNLLLSTAVFNSTYNSTYGDNGHTHAWVNLTDYPAACPANEFMVGVGDSITCTSVQETELSLKVVGNLTVTGNISVGTNLGVEGNFTTRDANVTDTLWVAGYNITAFALNLSTANTSLDNLLLSTATFNSTYNASYHAMMLSTATYNSTYNSSYEAVQLSTAVFNATYNVSYHIYAYNQTVAGNYTAFTSVGANTWNKPAIGTWVKIQIWAGGGSGGRGGLADAGGGGGGGGYNEVVVAMSDLSATETCNIGGGGASVTVDDTHGNTGSPTNFTKAGVVTYKVYGGGGGYGITGSTGPGGGGGGIFGPGQLGTGIGVGGAGGIGCGLSGVGVGEHEWGDVCGGGGGAPNDGGWASWGGSGGGFGQTTAGTSSNGGNVTYGGAGGGGGNGAGAAGIGGVSINGGNGGDGTTDVNVAGSGIQPAGGGGGSEQGNSGAGGAGKCIITVW